MTDIDAFVRGLELPKTDEEAGLYGRAWVEDSLYFFAAEAIRQWEAQKATPSAEVLASVQVNRDRLSAARDADIENTMRKTEPPKERK
jgi:hypothetical protein